jgi:hypothetical protein
MTYDKPMIASNCTKPIEADHAISQFIHPATRPLASNRQIGKSAIARIGFMQPSNQTQINRTFQIQLI